MGELDTMGTLFADATYPATPKDLAGLTFHIVLKGVTVGGVATACPVKGYPVVPTPFGCLHASTVATRGALRPWVNLDSVVKLTLVTIFRFVGATLLTLAASGPWGSGARMRPAAPSRAAICSELYQRPVERGGRHASALVPMVTTEIAPKTPTLEVTLPAAAPATPWAATRGGLTPLLRPPRVPTPVPPRLRRLSTRRQSLAPNCWRG